MMRRWIAVVAVAIAALLVTSASAATPLEVVRDEKGVDEQRPSRSDGYTVWDALDLDTFRQHSWVMADGGGTVRINPVGTQSDAAAIDGTTVAYVEGMRGESRDIRFYDVVTQDRWDPPEGVNTDAHEGAPALFGDWLVFRRTNTNLVPDTDAFVRLLLVNLDTLERRRLVDAMDRNRYVTPDQINGDWLTYESCRTEGFRYSNCQQFLYEISTGSRTVLPNPGLQQYAGGVTSDGTVYLVRSGSSTHWRCGKNARIVRVPLGGEGEVIHRFADGVDALAGFAFEESDDSVSYFVERLPCGRGSGGIYVLRNADTASL
jgi:hypothetical protein